jgi:hypothetical protein
VKRAFHSNWTFAVPPPVGDWITHAACRDTPVDVMVPARTDKHGRPLDEATYLANVQEAKKRCAICTVAATCRAYGLAISAEIEDHGVYGGLSTEERHKILGFASIYLPRGGPSLICGTAGAYSRHLRSGERPCSQCRAWKAERQRAYNQRKRDRQKESA